MRASQPTGSGPSHMVNSISSPSAKTAGERCTLTIIGGGVMADMLDDRL
jgi:hypothetical protein